MVIVCDASPLIFLAKLDRLDLIATILSERIVVPGPVRDEVMAGPVPPAEERLLVGFLARAEVVSVRRQGSVAPGLSLADEAVLTVALRRKADWVIADDRLLRELARAEGLRVMGTLGLLIRARRQQHLSAEEAVADLSSLVQRHGFRISTAVYDEVLRALSNQ